MGGWVLSNPYLFYLYKSMGNSIILVFRDDGSERGG